MLKLQFVLVLLVGLAGIVGCMPSGQAPERPEGTVLVEPNQAPAPVWSATPTDSLPLPTATLTPVYMPQPVQVCSPLTGFDLAQLSGMVVNPYAPPDRPGSDDPHQGIDLGVLAGNSRITIPGEQVQALLPGIVAAVISERFPYGNAVLVETSLESISGEIAARLPTPAPTPGFQAPLNCPEAVLVAINPDAPPALYILYAHMLELPAFAVGDAVECGQTLGQIGASGNALNPHLHLEVRLGPSGVQFGSLAHYEPRASEAEMAAYCTWRIKGGFQVVNPGLLLWGAVDSGTILAPPAQ